MIGRDDGLAAVVATPRRQAHGLQRREGDAFRELLDSGRHHAVGAQALLAKDVVAKAQVRERTIKTAHFAQDALAGRQVLQKLAGVEVGRTAQAIGPGGDDLGSGVVVGVGAELKEVVGGDPHLIRGQQQDLVGGGYLLEAPAGDAEHPVGDLVEHEVAALPGGGQVLLAVVFEEGQHRALKPLLGERGERLLGGHGHLFEQVLHGEHEDARDLRPAGGLDGVRDRPPSLKLLQRTRGLFKRDGLCVRVFKANSYGGGAGLGRHDEGNGGAAPLLSLLQAALGPHNGPGFGLMVCSRHACAPFQLRLFKLSRRWRMRRAGMLAHHYTASAPTAPEPSGAPPDLLPCLPAAAPWQAGRRTFTED